MIYFQKKADAMHDKNSSAHKAAKKKKPSTFVPIDHFYNIDCDYLSPNKPKDKRDVLHTAECVYEIPCLNCDKSYIGETARIFDKRLNEHKGEAEKASAKPFTRAQRTASVTGEQNKSALTDHVAEENHAIGWKSAKIRDREPNKRKRLIKELIWIRKKGGQTLNRDLGNYFLPNIYDQLLCERQPTAPPTIAKNKRQSAKFGH